MDYDIHFGLTGLWALLVLLPLLGMAFSHGKSTVVKMDNGAGALTDISAFLNSSSLERLRDLAESTVYGAGEKTYIAGLRDKTFSGEGRFDPALDAILNDDIEDDATKTLEYGPQGSASGAVRYSFEVLVTSYNTDGPVDDLNAMSFELQGTGLTTRDTWP